MKTRRKYTRELKKQFGYLATWFPGTPIALGDIGVFKRNEFTKISNLSDFGISFDIEQDSTKSDMEYSSRGGVSVMTKASGTAAIEGSTLGEIDAGITVKFSKEKAIFFKANGTTSPNIKNQIKLGEEVIELFKSGRWNKDWAVVTELVNVESATVLISNSSDGKIELKAKSKVAAVSLDIADANLGLEIKFFKDLSTRIVAQESLTPLFKASKVKGRWFLPPVFRANSLQEIDLMTPEEAKKNSESIYFGEVELEDDPEE